MSDGLLCNTNVPWIRFRTNRFVNGEDISTRELRLHFTPINRERQEFPVADVEVGRSTIEFIWNIPARVQLVVGRIRLAFEVSGEWQEVSNLNAVERGIVVSCESGSNTSDCNCDCGEAIDGINRLITNLSQSIDALNAELITSGGNPPGRWTRYPDGTLIISGTIAVSGAVNTPEGSLFRTDNITVSFPVPFTLTPSVTMTVTAGLLTARLQPGLSTAGFSFQGFSVNALGTATRQVHYQAIGRWR